MLCCVGIKCECKSDSEIGLSVCCVCRITSFLLVTNRAVLFAQTRQRALLCLFCSLQQHTPHTSVNHSPHPTHHPVYQHHTNTHPTHMPPHTHKKNTNRTQTPSILPPTKSQRAPSMCGATRKFRQCWGHSAPPCSVRCMGCSQAATVTLVRAQTHTTNSQTSTCWHRCECCRLSVLLGVCCCWVCGHEAAAHPLVCGYYTLGAFLSGASVAYAYLPPSHSLTQIVFSLPHTHSFLTLFV